MKKLSMLLLLIALSLTPIRAQTIPATANLTASDSGACTTPASCLTVNVTPSSAAAVIQLTGTFSATLQFEGTTSVGGTFVAIAASPVGGGSAVSSATATGSWRVTASGFAQIRVRCSAFTSGTVVAAITLSTGSSGTGNGTSGGAVSSVFGRTGAVAAAANDYTLDQIGNPAAAATFAEGNNFPTSFTANGTFSNVAGHYATLRADIGTLPCPVATADGGAHAEAMLACLNIPASSVTNSFSNALGAYALNNNPNNTGVFGAVEGVGVYGVCANTANNTKCIAMAPQAQDNSAGLTGSFLEGMEIAVIPQSTATQGYGILLNFGGFNIQPTGDNMPGYAIQSPTGANTATFTTGFECSPGSISATKFGACLTAGKNNTGAGARDSSLVAWVANNGSADIAVGMNYSKDGILGTSQTVPFLATSYTTYLTSTASLSPNQLVKVDTAHADSVVVCTTADTLCDGFVGEITSANCGAASTICPIITTTGSLAHGILGTGTCSIGNNVIVDTTTNGRVKCQAGQPAQGAWIGKAISAQASVGSTVDVLTKFQ